MTNNDPGQPPAHVRGVEVTHNLPTPAVALAVGAHPDDVEFGCGATLAKWAADGCVIHHVVLTDGSKGSWDVEADTSALVVRRQDEQREAARRLGGEHAGEVRFVGEVDGELAASDAVIREVVQAIRELRPTVVLGHDPWKRYRLHPDHRNAGWVVCDAIVAARDPHFLRDLDVAHHRPDALLLWEADEPNHVEDVSVSIDAKLDALLAHESQFQSTMKAVDSKGLDDFRNRITRRLSDLGAPYGYAVAEVFARISPL